MINPYDQWMRNHQIPIPEVPYYVTEDGIPMPVPQEEADMSDRGGSTNPSTNTFGKIIKGNPEGRGGATQSTGFGPIGTYPLGTTTTNPTNNTNKVGKDQPAS